MSQMTPKERVERLFKKEPIDTMPLFSGMGMVCIQAVKELGIRFAQVHTTAKNLADSARKTAEMYGFDAVIVPYDMCTIPEALGRGVSLYEQSEDILYPTVPNKWAKLEDVDIPADFLTRGRMPVVDEAMRLLKSGNGYPLGGWVLGPFTMAGQIIELDLLLKGVKKDKDRVVAFLDKMTDLVLKTAQHYEEIGADYITIRDMGTGTDLLSPRMWKQFIMPNLQRIFENLKKPCINHICGSTDLIIEMMNDCGATAVSVDHKNHVEESRKKLGNDALIFGDFDAYGLLVTGEASAVEPAIKQTIERGVDAVWPGCDLWPDVKKENVEALVAAVRKHGKGRSPAVGRV